MKSLHLLTDEQLVQEFADLAQRVGEAVVNWMPANRLTRQLFAARNVLRERGQQSRSRLEALLKNGNRFVRYYAAQELYGLFPQQCRPIIEENTREFDAIAGDARGFLRAIDEGTYKPQ